MPLSKAEDFGTSAEGFRQNDYCHYCYQDGAFTQPDITLEQMTEFCVQPTASATGMAEAEAWALLERTLPFLNRWRAA